MGGLGITDPQGLRTAPSAGALYPLEICLAAGEVTVLLADSYRYLPRKGAIACVLENDWRAVLAASALGHPA